MITNTTRKILLELISILLLLEIYPNLIAVSDAQAQTNENGWMKGAPMPTPRTEVTAASLDDDVYIIGGFTSDGVVSELVEMYNSTSDSWKTDIAPLPVPLHHASAVGFDDKIYVVGGYGGNWEASNRIFIFDPTTNSWDTGDPMNIPRGSPNANVVNDTIFVIGGDLDEQPLNSIESYNITTNKWSTHTPMPTARHHAASAVVDGNIYVIGGRLTSSLINTDIVERYSPINDSWTTDLEPMPSKRSGIAAASINGSIYVLGGEQNRGTFDDMERYDPHNNTWIREVPMLTARHGLGVESVDGIIYAIGGGPYPGLTVSGENEIYHANRTAG